LPIVIITGYGSAPSAVEAMRVGASDYVEKPFTPTQITEAVGRAIGPVDGGEQVTIAADLVREILGRAGRDEDFRKRLLYEGSEALSGFAISSAAKAAIVGGDIGWIERNFGELSPQQRDWLEHRLQAEIW